MANIMLLVSLFTLRVATGDENILLTNNFNDDFKQKHNYLGLGLSRLEITSLSHKKAFLTYLL